MNNGIRCPRPHEFIKMLTGEMIMYVVFPKNYYPEIELWRVAISSWGDPPATKRVLVRAGYGVGAWLQVESNAEGYPQ